MFSNSHVLMSTIQIDFHDVISYIKFKNEDYPPSWSDFKLAVAKEFLELEGKSFTVKTESGVDLKRLANKFQSIVLLNTSYIFCIHIENDAAPNFNNEGSISKKVKIGLGIGVGVAAAIVAAPAIIAGLGFGTAGVTAGSYAAAWMSASGSIVAGSLFATLQSAGAAGLGSVGYAIAASAGAVMGGSTVAGTAALANIAVKMWNKDGNDPKMPLILLPNGNGVMIMCSSKFARRSEDGTSAKDDSSSYNKRAKELKQLFKDLPSDEFLIADYSCELMKSSLVQGRLYLTQNFFCFYSKILGVETTHVISCNEIIAITKERSALVIPNAFKITTISEKYFFIGLATRNKTYDLLDYLWKKSCREEITVPIDALLLITIIYGEDLGFSTLEELIAYFLPSDIA